MTELVEAGVLPTVHSSSRQATQKAAEFEDLAHRYHKQAYNIAYRMTGNHADAEDLTQEAFVRAFRFFGNYRRDWPFDNWLYKIMSNLFVDDLRRKPKARLQSLDQPLDNGGRSDDIYLEIPDAASNPERLMLSHELDEQIQRALSALPTDFRVTESWQTSRACPIGDQSNDELFSGDSAVSSAQRQKAAQKSVDAI